MAKTRKPPKKWARVLAHDVEFAKRRLLDRGALEPMVIIHNTNGSVTPLAVRFDGPEHKAKVFGVLAMIITAVDAAAVSIMVEAWLRRLAQRSGESKAELEARCLDGPSPGEAEDRIEVIMLSVLYRDSAGQRQAIWHYGEIVRDAAGTVIALKPLDDETDGSAAMGGEMTEIMSEYPPDGAIRQKVQAIMAEHGATLMARLGIVEFGS